MKLRVRCGNLALNDHIMNVFGSLFSSWTLVQLPHVINSPSNQQQRAYVALCLQPADVDAQCYPMEQTAEPTDFQDGVLAQIW